VQKFHSEQK